MALQENQPGGPQWDAVLFDYGNTLMEFDTPQLEFVLQGLVGTYGELLGPVEPEVLRRAIHEVITTPAPDHREIDPREEVAFLLERGWGEQITATPDLIERCNEVLQSYFVESIALETDVPDVLAELRQSFRLGMVSNYPCGTAIRRSLDRVDIAHFFDPIVISGEFGYVKPHRGIFEAALAHLDVSPGRVLFVGDRWDADMVGAHQVGMKTCHHIGLTRDASWKEKYAEYEPDLQIQSLTELKGVLLNRIESEGGAS